MAFTSLILTALLSAANPTLEPPAMACRFAPDNAPATWISLRPEAETKRPGLFTVRLWVQGQAVIGNAVALEKTEARDVVVRGVTGDKTTWLIAIRDNGAAFLRTSGASTGTGDEQASMIAARGACTNFQSAMDIWLPD